MSEWPNGGLNRDIAQLEILSMAEVPDHLVPTDGLTNSNVRLDEVSLLHSDGTVVCTFGIYGEDQGQIGEFAIEVENRGGNSDQIFAEAHRQMTDVLRQWLFVVDTHRQVYEKQAARSGQG